VFLQWELVSLRVTGFMVNMITLTIRTLFALANTTNYLQMNIKECRNNPE